MNLLLTNYCNRSCAYCFAQGKIQGKEKKRLDFNPENLDRVISFARKSGLKRVDLLGGEPTLNPHFEAIVEGFLEKNIPIQIFTNGIMSRKTLSFIKNIPAEKSHSLINVNPPEKYRKSEWEKLERTLNSLGTSASLGFNIDTVDFSYSFLFDLIRKYRLKRFLRIGIAQPILGADNRFVPFDRYKDLTARIMQLVKNADRDEVVVTFDCGFTLCMFTPAQLGRLYLARTQLKFYCNPAIDIGPDLSIWHCFPLSGIDNVRLHQFENEDEVARFYLKRMAPYKRMGAADRCRRCKYLLRGQCPGGCLAHTINRFKKG